MESNTENNFTKAIPNDINNENVVDWRSHPISIYKEKIWPEESFKCLRKPVKRFYEQQNKLINQLIEVSKYEDSIDESQNYLENIVALPQDHCHRHKSKLKIPPKDIDEILAKSVFAINFILLIAKGVAAGMTGSLSIISSLLDSCIDLLSGIIMWCSARGMKQFNPYLYPQGRQRLEPISIIVLSVLMAVISIQLINESVQTIINMATAGLRAPNVNNISIVIICTTIFLKIILWIICWKFGSSETSAALAQDSRNDVFNNVVAILCSSLSGRLGIDNLKYLDPCGAISIAIYIFVGWCKTGYDNVKTLAGHTASSSFLQKMTFIAVNHHPDIQYIDTVRAFHFGVNFLVEIDIVLDENMPVKTAHDIGESLQKRIECLEEVERCFVHIDYEYDHNPRHEHKLV